MTVERAGEGAGERVRGVLGGGGAGEGAVGRRRRSLLGKTLAAARVLGLSVARAGALLVRRYS